jgi:hypothetical protein
LDESRISLATGLRRTTRGPLNTLCCNANEHYSDGLDQRHLGGRVEKSALSGSLAEEVLGRYAVLPKYQMD